MAEKVNSFRYERKYVVHNMSKHEIFAILKMHPALFSEIFYERKVNNIYFDSIDESGFLDNVVGIADRIKYRIRWYGNLFGQIKRPVLEIKTKRGVVGTKDSYPMKSFSLNNSTSGQILDKILYSGGLDHSTREFFDLGLSPSLLNTYSRRYFQSADKKFWITVDDGLRYYKLKRMDNNYLYTASNLSSIIVELKYDKSHDLKAEKISNNFPFRLTKNSKYVQGLELLSFSN